MKLYCVILSKAVHFLINSEFQSTHEKIIYFSGDFSNI